MTITSEIADSLSIHFQYASTTTDDLDNPEPKHFQHMQVAINMDVNSDDTYLQHMLC